MSIWTDYSSRTPSGVAGGLYDLTNHAVDSFRINAADGKVKCGMGVVHGPNPGSDVDLPAESSTLDKFAGVVMNGGSNEMDMEGNIVLRNSSTQSVMRHGRVWVRLAAEAEPAYGDQAHLVLTGKDIGCFGTSGGLAVNARFLTTAHNGIAAIELYNLIAAPAAASTTPTSPETPSGN